MAKNTNLNTSEVKEETVVAEQVVAPAKTKKEKPAKKQKKAKVEAAQKKSKIKETVGELKKVTWPSFGKTMKQTGMVLSIVLVFGLVVLGIDLLISFIINLLSSF